MDKCSFPVATKDLTNILGHEVGKPYLPSKPSTEAEREGLREVLRKCGYLK